MGNGPRRDGSFCLGKQERKKSKKLIQVRIIEHCGSKLRNKMQTLDLTVSARVYDNKMKLCRGKPGRRGTEQEQGRNVAVRFLGHCRTV